LTYTEANVDIVPPLHSYTFEEESVIRTEYVENADSHVEAAELVLNWINAPKASFRSCMNVEPLPFVSATQEPPYLTILSPTPPALKLQVATGSVETTGAGKNNHRLIG